MKKKILIGALSAFLVLTVGCTEDTGNENMTNIENSKGKDEIESISALQQLYIDANMDSTYEEAIELIKSTGLDYEEDYLGNEGFKTILVWDEDNYELHNKFEDIYGVPAISVMFEFDETNTDNLMILAYSENNFKEENDTMLMDSYGAAAYEDGATVTTILEGINYEADMQFREHDSKEASIEYIQEFKEKEERMRTNDYATYELRELNKTEALFLDLDIDMDKDSVEELIKGYELEYTKEESEEWNFTEFIITDGDTIMVIAFFGEDLAMITYSMAHLVEKVNDEFVISYTSEFGEEFYTVNKSKVYEEWDVDQSIREFETREEAIKYIYHEYNSRLIK